MRTKSTELSAHSKKVLELLAKSAKPMTAYEILDKLRKFGIKAPPTVYRALDTLVERGMVHRIESLNAFVACHDEDEEDQDHNHTAQFAVCRSCGSVTEIHDHRLSDLIHELCKKLKFRIEREMLELLGLCQQCEKKAGA
jgi:Fur family transcriptional regulator, zinc uptake regulator